MLEINKSKISLITSCVIILEGKYSISTKKQKQKATDESRSKVENIKKDQILSKRHDRLLIEVEYYYYYVRRIL